MKHIKKYKTSEEQHKDDVLHFSVKSNNAHFSKKSPEERKELKKRIKSFPNRNGTPVGYNP